MRCFISIQEDVLALRFLIPGLEAATSGEHKQPPGSLAFTGAIHAPPCGGFRSLLCTVAPAHSIEPDFAE